MPRHKYNTTHPPAILGDPPAEGEYLAIQKVSGRSCAKTGTNKCLVSGDLLNCQVQGETQGNRLMILICCQREAPHNQFPPPIRNTCTSTAFRDIKFLLLDIQHIAEAPVLAEVEIAPGMVS